VTHMVPFLVVLLLIAPGLGATEGRCIQQTRYWGGDGPAQTLAVVNGCAFFGGHTLRVADLADPTDPKVVSEVRLDGYAADLEVNGDRVYAVDYTSELTVIDATNPYAPTVEASFAPEDPYWNLYWIDIQNDLAMVGGKGDWSIPNSNSNLMFLDVSDASRLPPLLGSLQLNGIVESIALGNQTAVATTRLGPIWFIDISDPTAPFVAREMMVPDLIVSGQASDLETYEDLLAISDTEGRVTLIDISDPGAPEYLALIQDLEIGIPDLEFEGPMLHATGSSCTSSGVCGGYALVNCFAPRNPDLVGRVDGPLMAGPAPHAGHVMAAAFKAGMRVVDLQGLTNPAMLDVVLPAREVGAIASADRLMHVVDVTTLADPEEPDRNTLKVLRRLSDGSLSEVASYGPEGAIWALAGDGDYVAAAIYNEETEFHSVEIIDVSDPASPEVGTRLGARLSQEFETYAPHLRMHDDRLILSLEDSNEILIYEMFEGGVATQVGNYLPGAEMLHFAVSSRDVMAVAVREGAAGWVEIVDTHVPSSSVVAGIVDLPEPADVPVTVEAERDRVVVLVQDIDGQNGPHNYSILVDVADPTNPAITMDDLPGGLWVAITAGVQHTIGDTYPPAGVRHWAVDVTNPPDADEVENLGYLDVSRDRVDADGPFFCLSRGRLEVHRYGNCGPLAVPIVSLAELE